MLLAKEDLLNCNSALVSGISPESRLFETLKNLRLLWFNAGTSPVNLLSSKYRVYSRVILANDAGIAPERPLSDKTMIFRRWREVRDSGNLPLRRLMFR